MKLKMLVILAAAMCMAADKPVSYLGQMFVTFNDGRSVKLAGVKVYALPLPQADDAFATYNDHIDLPAPLASAVSDADGRFKLTVPGSDEFMIYARTTRELGRNEFRYQEIDEWRVKSGTFQDRENVLLSNENMSPPIKDKTVTVADQ